MASIDVIKQALVVCKHTNITPFIWGHHAVGKSSLVRQLATANNWGFIDFRASLIEAADLRGNSERVNGRTCFCPPEDMPYGDMSQKEVDNLLAENGTTIEYITRLHKAQAHFPHGILFLDEINRAENDVLQASFQLVLDRAIGQYVLPPGWMVVTAGNYSDGEYIVSGFDDPAFLDRFCHLTVSTGPESIDDWVRYMMSIHGTECLEVVSYATQNIKTLDGNQTGNLGFEVMPSRRSWDAVVRVRKYCLSNNIPIEIIREVYAGLVGHVNANAFLQYTCPIHPKQLLEDGIKKHQKTIVNLARSQLMGLTWGLASYCAGRTDDETISTICLDFVEVLLQITKQNDIVVSFCRSLIINNSDKSSTLAVCNPEIANIMAAHNKRTKKKMTFVDYLAQRPNLQKAVSNVSWGA